MTRRAGRHGSMASVVLSEAEKVYIVHGVQVAEAVLRIAAGPRVAGEETGVTLWLNSSAVRVCSPKLAAWEFLGDGDERPHKDRSPLDFLG